MNNIEKMNYADALVLFEKFAESVKQTERSEFCWENIDRKLSVNSKRHTEIENVVSMSSQNSHKCFSL